MAIEIVDDPINSMVIFHSYVSLPDGKRDNVDVALTRFSRFLGGKMMISW